MPAQMGLGITYDVYLAEFSTLDLNFTFLANSFTKDQFNFGVGYEFKEIVRLSVGYLYENGIAKADERNTVYTGPSMGLNVNVPLGKGGVALGLDYAYRFTNPFGGFHQFGLRLVF
jgi:outer membrane translocation and assembly module TamA